MFRNATLGAQLAAGFVLAFVLTLAVGLIGWTATTDLRARLARLGAEDVARVEALGVLAEAHTAVMRRLNGTALGTDMSLPQRANSAEQARKAMARYDEGFAALDAAGGALRAALAAAARSDAQFRATAVEAFRLAEARDARLHAGASREEIAAADRRIRALWERAAADVKVADADLERLRAAQRAETARHLAEANAASDRAVRWVAGALAVAALLLVGLAWLLVRRVGRSVRGLVDEAAKLTAAATAGQLDVRGEPAAVAPDFRPVVEGMNATVAAFAAPVRTTAEVVGRIAAGDLPPPIAAPWTGEYGLIKDALNRCVERLSGVLGAMDEMSRAQIAGDYEAAVAEERFEGAYRRVAAGVNAGVRHHVGALLHVFEILQAYGAGDFSRELRRFPGKQAVAHETMDRVRDNLRAVAAEVQALGREAREGHLDARADAARFRGEWAEMVGGINATLEAVVVPLRGAARFTERIAAGAVPEPVTREARGEFEAVRRSLNGCAAAVRALVEDADGLARAAVEGRLSARAEAGRHQGDFRRIVDGVNATLDAVVAPVEEATQVLERLARRDLRARMAGSYLGDHDRIRQAVNGTGEALHDALVQVAEAAEHVSGAATQIASSSQAVASGASEQAAAIEETGASLEAVSAQTGRSAGQAEQASASAAAARDAAGEGARSVARMQEAMERIRASAEGTSQIIRDVSEIAFQTNLLALNAAVEAARAGDAGRGFAVVAEEVRSLAQRAKDAAQKTEGLIRESVRHAGEGAATARHVAGKLDEIVASVTGVTGIVGEIAAAAREQAAGIAQVGRAVVEMDKVTQQNAASAEESSSAASELSGQAEELAAMVGAFQLERDAAAGGRRREPARALAAA